VAAQYAMEEQTFCKQSDTATADVIACCSPLPYEMGPAVMQSAQPEDTRQDRHLKHLLADSNMSHQRLWACTIAQTYLTGPLRARLRLAPVAILDGIFWITCMLGWHLIL